ncbi:glycosyltransferase [Marivirga sp.]|uniref:glycosyltransferase family 2 protein n=1 Tax=Marivirga sp. TaxID=2018662 RepID=UPI002D8061A1|nr:glycosyltransferase [Marivirga sp.]HET8858321.1 glycosyltransferase [Marivirga sp.]
MNLKDQKKYSTDRKNTLYSFLFPLPLPVTENKKSKQNQYDRKSYDFISGIKGFFTNNTGAIILIATFSILISALISFFYLQPQLELLHNNRLNSVWGTIFIITSLSLLGFKLLFYLFIFVNYLKYKAVKAVTPNLLPSCTVIVPAYNEGELVWKTLKSLAASDYPADKMQIISIDDGSKDDTWEWMKKAKSELGDRVEILKQPKNMGKRHALYGAFNIGIGEIFITVDSDSIVNPDTLKNLVSPFVTNKNCGAVAGNVKVLNNKKAIIPKMLNVSFAFSFEFIRSAQSNLGTVLCTPGALAAYKREAVMGCLNDWINQTFFGKPTDIGEDRAMTNMILKQGYDVKFQSNAQVLTNIPEKYNNLQKMYTRWERSNVRENIMMSRFAFTNFRKGSKIGTRILLINQWVRVLTAIPATLIMLLFISFHPLLFISTSLVSVLIFSSIPAFFYAKKHTISECFYMYAYSIFYAFGLFWITPYAIATANKRGWLTRGLPQKN